VERRYPARRLADLTQMTREQRAELAAATAAERSADGNRRSFHPPAVAHFYGFWMDESEVGTGDADNVSRQACCKEGGSGECAGSCGSGRDRECAAQPAACLALPANVPTACLRPCLLARLPACLPRLPPSAALQIWVGDYITIDMEDENSKGWSIAQVEELYQDPTVSMDVLHA
jgi:hypothetical protein